MNFAAFKMQNSLQQFAKKVIASCFEACTCVQSPFTLLLALKEINHRATQSSHPRASPECCNVFVLLSKWMHMFS